MGRGPELRHGGRRALEGVIGAVSDAVAGACRELGGNRSKSGSGRGSSRNPRRSPPRYESRPVPLRSVLQNRPDRAEIEGQNQPWNDSRPDRRPVPGRVGNPQPATRFRSLRPPWRSSDPGPSGRSQQQPPNPRTSGDVRDRRPRRRVRTEPTPIEPRGDRASDRGGLVLWGEVGGRAHGRAEARVTRPLAPRARDRLAD